MRTQRPILDTSEPRHYPLSLDEKIREIEQFARTEKTLSQSLGNIERYFSTPQAGLHTGTPNCDRCAQKKRQIWEAYCEYYLGREPDRWDSRLHAYREEMHQMLNSIPAKYSLEDVHRRFEQELRDDLQRDMSGTQPDLGKMGLTELKDLRARRLEQHHTSADTEVDAPTIHSEEAIAFMTALQASKTSKERIQVYVKYYCTPSWSDTPAQKAIKAKYARLFERGFSHDVVLAKWKAEALESHDREISKQRHRLAELKMAQSAHLRSKAKRAEKDQRMQDREYVFVQKPTATCSLEGCEQEISLGEGEEVVECAVCLWLAGKDRSEGRRHSYYCSEAHLEEDFVSVFCLSGSDPKLIENRNRMIEISTPVQCQIIASTILSQDQRTPVKEEYAQIVWIMALSTISVLRIATDLTL